MIRRFLRTGRSLNVHKEEKETRRWRKLPREELPDVIRMMKSNYWIGGARSTHGVREKCIQSFGRNG
jgi:hypothetical protein